MSDTSIPGATSPAAAPMLVACLCAEWCSSCREYRDVFRQIEQQYPDIRFLWIDIEDQPDVVGDISVEDFPTLLIASGVEPDFFGPLTPQREVLMRLLEAHRIRSDRGALRDRELWALVARLRAIVP